MEDKLLSIISEILEINKDDLSDDLSVKNGDWDSLMHIQIISAIEYDFGIMFTAEEITEMLTIANIKEITLNKTKE